MSATIDTNARMAALHCKYGRNIAVEYFFPDTWRVWVHGWHIHKGIAIHGSWAAGGHSVDGALDHLESQAAKTPPVRGDNCLDGCPHYLNDCY